MATQVAAAETLVELPDVVGLTLDKATAQLEKLDFKVKAKDVKDDKTILKKSNWQVVSQDPGKGIKLEEGRTVILGVKPLTDETATPTATPTPTAVQPEVVAPVAPPVVAAPPVVEAPPVVVAPPVEPPVAEAPPVVVAPPVAPPPAAVSYKNCDAVRAAGAAPIHISQPGYGKHLDKDGDGWGCDK